MLMSPSFSIPILLGVLLGYLLGLVSRGLGKNRTMKDGPTYFFKFDKLLLGLMLLSAFVLGVFLTYFFFICV
jgi:Na+/H+-dicarboxylate symporter